jgi:tetratricopeptide (TPR) repeat protein/energy-coupling factor transporter ATP-binding protein EcfA2
MTDVSTPESLFSWIHLADLQIGRGNGAHGWERQLVLEELRKDIAAYREYGVPAPDAIFVTGDIARSGAAEEYASARDWLLGVAGSVGLGPDRVFVVPGNHDVDRSADRDRATIRLVQSLRAGSEQIDAVLQEPEDRARLAARLSRYLRFAEGFAPGCLGAHSGDQQALFWAHRLDARGGLRVRVLGLNTALVSVDDTDQGKLRLGNEQIDRGLRNPSIERAELVIALSHHPLQGGWLADEENASGWIHSRAHVHMHGQVHNAGSESTRSGGGGGLVRMAAGAGRSHSYAFAAVGTTAGKVDLRIWPRAWSEKNKRFVVGVDSTPDGQAFATHALRVELGAKKEAPRSPLPATALFEGPGAMPALPVPNFLGRSAELDALRRALAGESEAVCVVASGIGGIGKTTLVRQFVATEAAQLFVDGVAWIDATALPSELARVAQRFGWKSERLPTVDEANKWLAVTLNDRSVLLVVDNVDPEHVDAKEIPIPGGRCRTLITSRSAALHEDLGKPAQMLPLGKWSDATCREYLQRVAKRDDLQRDLPLDELAHFVGNLPLAIRLIAKLLTRGTPPERLLAQIKAQPLGTLDAVARGADRGVAQTFVTAFQELNEDERSVLVALSACARATRAEVVAKVADVTEATAARALVALWEQRSLVEFDVKAARPWGLHDVVRLFLRGQDGAKDATSRHHDFVETHLRAHESPSAWEAAEQEMPEVLEAVTSTLREGEMARASGLILLARQPLMSRGRYPEFYSILVDLEARLPVGGNERARTLDDIAMIFKMQRRLREAVQCLGKAFDICRAGGYEETEALTLTRLAGCHVLLGDLASAEASARGAESIANKIKSTPIQAESLASLASICLASGRHEEALSYASASLARYVAAGDRVGELKALSLEGSCHAISGHPFRAIVSWNSALAIAQEKGRVLDRALLLHQVGVAYFQAGDEVTSVSYLEKGLSVFQRELGWPSDQIQVVATRDALIDVVKRLSSAARGSMEQKSKTYYVTRVKVEGVRSIERLDWKLTRERAPGWHIILGDNGSGKSTFLRSLALTMVGQPDAATLARTWGSLPRADAVEGALEITFARPAPFELLATPENGAVLSDSLVTLCLRATREGIVEESAKERRVWPEFSDIFSASYGPFRRFSRGNAEYEGNVSGRPRLARHISLFDSSVALTESLEWIKTLHHKKLDNKIEGSLLEPFKALANAPGPPFFLPHGIRLADVTSSGAVFKDGNGFDIPIEDLSDGYRAVLSFTFDLIRHMAIAFGYDRLFDPDDTTVVVPGGIVLIDEIDVHLHPTWQRQIGLWFKKHFPNVQFIVTTHSPLVCQTADSIFVLPAPGSDEEPHMLDQAELDRIRYGNVLDAYGTGAFGRGVTRSEKSKEMRKRLVALNRKEVDVGLSQAEQEEQSQLRAVMPSAVSSLGSDSREGGA